MSPKIRQTLYAVGTIATAALTLLSVWKVLDPSTASTVNGALAALLSLLGAGAAGTAAVVTGQQRKDGTFDTVNPADQVVQGIEAVLAQAENAKSDVQRVKDAVSAVTQDIPVLGPLAQQALNSLPS